MNSAHLHLITVHLPVILTWVVLLLGVLSLWLKNKQMEITALGLLFASVAAACVAYFSGGYAFEWLSNSEFPIEKQLAEEHAVIARAALIANVVLAIVAFNVGMQYVQRTTPPVWLRGILWAAVAVVGILYAWAAHQGGEIRHPEIEASTTERFDATAQHFHALPSPFQRQSS